MRWKDRSGSGCTLCKGFGTLKPRSASDLVTAFVGASSAREQTPADSALDDHKPYPYVRNARRVICRSPTAVLRNFMRLAGARVECKRPGMDIV